MECRVGGKEGWNVNSRIHTSPLIQVDTMVRCLLLSTITDHRGRFEIDWSGIVEESSKGRPGGASGPEGSSEGGGDGGQGPSLSLEDGTSKDGRAKRHLDVRSAEGKERARTSAKAILDPEVTISRGIKIWVRWLLVESKVDNKTRMVYESTRAKRG